MNILKKIQNKNIVRASIISAVLIISTVLSNIVASKAAVDTVAPPHHAYRFWSHEIYSILYCTLFDR